MTDAQALRLIAMLASYFRQEVSEETAVLWARDISEFEVEDGMEAAEALGSSGRFMPSLAEFRDAITDCRNYRLRRLVPALPPGAASSGPWISFAQWYNGYATPEQQEKALRYLPRKLTGKVENG